MFSSKANDKVQAATARALEQFIAEADANAEFDIKAKEELVDKIYSQPEVIEALKEACAESGQDYDKGLRLAKAYMLMVMTVAS